MKKSTLLLTLLIGFMFLGCSEKSVTHSKPETEEKSIEERLAKDLPVKFQDDLSSLNACTVVYCLQRKRIYKY